MKAIYQNNKFYIFCLALLFALGGVLLVLYDKPDILLFLNQNRNGSLDLYFSWATTLGEEPMYFIIAGVLLFYRIGHGLVIGLIGFIVMITSYLLKLAFAVDRPLAFFRKSDFLDQILLVDGIDVHSGATSFPSGHSMSAFALYGLLILLLPKKKWIVMPLVTIATSVAISRIYLVQHFFIDVYFGSLIGVILSMLLFHFYCLKFSNEHSFLAKAIWEIKSKKH